MRDGKSATIAEILESTRAMFDAASTPIDAELEAKRRRDQVECMRAADLKRERDRKVLALRSSSLALSDDDAAAIVDGAYTQSKPIEHVAPWAQRVRSFDDDVPRMLVLCGGLGTGKTFAAGVALNSLGGCVVRASRLAAVVDPWRDELREGEARIDLRQRFIVLDDLGAERDSSDPRWAEALFEFVDTRMDRGMHTLITSNLRKKQFRERYGERVVDRLNHVAKVVEIPGASMRRKAGGL